MTVEQAVADVAAAADAGDGQGGRDGEDGQPGHSQPQDFRGKMAHETYLRDKKPRTAKASLIKAGHGVLGSLEVRRRDGRQRSEKTAPGHGGIRPGAVVESSALRRP